MKNKWINKAVLRASVDLAGCTFLKEKYEKIYVQICNLEGIVRQKYNDGNEKLNKILTGSSVFVLFKAPSTGWLANHTIVNNRFYLQKDDTLSPDTMVMKYDNLDVILYVKNLN